MTNESLVLSHRAFVILNPVAGNSSAGNIQEMLKDFGERHAYSLEIYETTGKEDVAEVARQACRGDIDLILAAGGDGTVAGVVNGAMHTDVSVGIIPVGTGNGLARALRIPLDTQEAIALIGGEHTFQSLDAMQVGDQYFVLNVSAGISSKAMNETDPEDKRRFGMLAYAQNILKDAMEGQDHHFRLVLDGHEVHVRAIEVLVSNGVLLKQEPILFGSREQFNDGQLNVNIVTASKPTELVRLAWDVLMDPTQPKEDIHDLTVEESVILDVVDGKLPVQADGEVIGETPVEIRLVRSAIRVVVPIKDEKEE